MNNLKEKIDTLQTQVETLINTLQSLQDSFDELSKKEADNLAKIEYLANQLNIDVSGVSSAT